MTNLPAPTRRTAEPHRFTLDFQPVDDLSDGQRWSTYWDVEALCRGPEPRPTWVVEDRAAVDTELGVLKTGKEADVFLLHRAVPGGDGVVLAAKRYRGEEHRTFHRSAEYTEGRRGRNSRDARALAKKTKHGRSVAAGQWAAAEWEALKRFWLAGVSVPYPVQIDGTEILMELVTEDGEPAPRLAAARPGGALCWSPTSSRSVTSSPGSPAPGSRTGTCRRTTCWPPGRRWSSSTCRRSWTSSPTRRAPTSSCATAATWAAGSSAVVWRWTSTTLFGDVLAQAY